MGFLEQPQICFETGDLAMGKLNGVFTAATVFLHYVVTIRC
jgi:hypothetical protein